MQLWCEAEDGWERTRAGLTALKPCATGFGYIRRPCSATGEWGEEITSYCCGLWRRRR